MEAETSRPGAIPEKYLEKDSQGRFVNAEELIVFCLQEYEKSGKEEAVEIAFTLAYAENLGALVPEPQVAWCQSLLGELLRHRHGRTGRTDDVSRAVQLGERAVAQSGDLDVQLHLTNAFLLRYGVFAGDEDLQRAIQGLQSLLKEAKSRREALLESQVSNNLSYALVRRFERFGALEDLDNGIELAKAAADAAPNTLLQAQRLNVLSSVLGRRYERTGNTADLDRAIATSQKAIDIALAHPGLYLHQINLSNWLAWRYEHEGKTHSADLDDAIQLAKEALDKSPRGSPYGAQCMGNLCKLLGWLYTRDGDVDALNSGIQHGKRGLWMLQEPSPPRLRLLSNVGELLVARFEKLGQEADFHEAVQLRKEAVDSAVGGPATYRLNIAHGAALSFTRLQKLPEALDFAKQGVQLLDRASSRSLDRSDQQSALGRYGGLASLAAALELECGGPPSSALALLEQGRGVMAAHHYNARTDLSDLQNQHPQEASSLKVLLEYLDGDAAAAAGLSSRHTAEQKLDSLVDTIRGLDGFERFLQPPDPEELKKVSLQCRQAFVVVNIAFRCDAFLVHNKSISSIRLPETSDQDIQDMVEDWERGTAKLRYELLEDLWDSIASPVLSGLGVAVEQPASLDAPGLHICWIPTTAALSSLPLHAAGYHRSRGPAVLDCAVSSYSTSIRASIYTHLMSRHAKAGTDDARASAILVAMPTTTGLRDLPNSSAEVAALRQVLSESGRFSSISELSASPKDTILRELENCSVFHFAGHGMVDYSDVSQSALVVDGGDRITVSDLQERHLYRAPPLLAYLSACNTAINVSSRLADESIHLVAACQIAGFQNVIGTLWAVSDSFCVGLAEEVYREVLENGKSWAMSLHLAVKKERDSIWPGEVQLQSDRARVTRDGVPDTSSKAAEEGLKNPGLWAAYVHMGVETAKLRRCKGLLSPI